MTGTKRACIKKKGGGMIEDMELSEVGVPLSASISRYGIFHEINTKHFEVTTFMETPQGLQSEFSYVPWSSPADASDLVMDW